MKYWGPTSVVTKISKKYRNIAKNPSAAPPHPPVSTAGYQGKVERPVCSRINCCAAHIPDTHATCKSKLNSACSIVATGFNPKFAGDQSSMEAANAPQPA